MGSLNQKKQARLKRKKSIRKKITGTSRRPRLSVFRSSKHIYVQVIDDVAEHTLVSASTVEKEATAQPELKGKIEKAAFIGKIIGQRAVEKGIRQVVFDRNGFLYHGRVKAVSDGAREAGLVF